MSNNPAAGIDLLCLDVDGVMTDGGIQLSYAVEATIGGGNTVRFATGPP